ncbi:MULTISPECIES: hypothetical protein [unclassified Vibrio]|uniref:hypothetical protein n=1 Tax=unclassified Vibrio TaxID=2614977 RepID=UPI001372BAF0|nr:MULTISPECIES: hypothetical protein [unclassified Vibrio]NAW70176.1 hypothetical protein [Vibrio sp. V28_P6S34P95]NAX05551.1 hypothetical protein [Vibrio sp. V30_P3S12P165]NAX36083.1 hypothetical protein [Vibrio sp. V27_P1S3P104]NAX41718.1 hypothetical protein [Vibrio sp. V26_P1S5P106]NNN45223.1 hypothetical protein [Vibrio sp. 1-1(7)]
MLLDILTQSVNEFQVDCLKLCEKHYPTIHNQGMSEHHLGLAFARRLARTLTEFGHQCEYAPLDLFPVHENPHHFRVSCDKGTVWILTHHMISAGKTCREKLLQDISLWKQEYAYAIQPNDLLLLLTDHWISRSQKSRELLHWWTGRLPDEINDYHTQGITLYESDSQLMQTVDNTFNISPCYVKFGHPLKRSKNQQLVRKYIQLYAVLQGA